MNIRIKLLFTFICMFFLVLAVPIYSFSTENKGIEEVLNGFEEDDPESEDALSGFDEEVEDISPAEEDIEKNSIFSLDGYFKIGTAFNIDNDDKKNRWTIHMWLPALPVLLYAVFAVQHLLHHCFLQNIF